jgi:hypothetical protein
MLIQRQRLQAHGIVANQSTVRRGPSSQVRITAVFQRAVGQALHLRIATRSEGQHLAIGKALGVDPQPWEREKRVHRAPKSEALPGLRPKRSVKPCPQDFSAALLQHQSPPASTPCA